MPRKNPTKKQRSLLKFIEQFTETHNYSPSYREIMRAMGLNSVAGVAEHVENCVAAGYLRKVPRAARSLEVVPRDQYPETAKLLRKKLGELATEAERGVEGIENEEAKEKIRKKIQNQRQILKKAAKILEIEL